ncbi:MAG: helix-turn-helix transcriptional regulator [Defluviitaleaceae bacterium]|nr:helix-turn-helix transcriptional regulator [Defluviitaleaceae bacterium]MCL2218076.1 helix-turn-helix transcriptional regulator [Defluviitaleaceae bacterium]
MELGKKIKALREKRGLTQVELGQLLNFDKSYINHIEKGRRPILSENLEMLKKALEVEGVPLTEEEQADFIKEIYSCMLVLFTREFEVAAELLPDLERRAGLSLEPSLHIYYDLLYTRYLFCVEEYAAHAAQVEILGKKENLNEEQLCMYYRELGTRELENFEYKKALSYFRRTEELSYSLAPENMSVIYYTNYAILFCLTDMDYPNQALDYLDKTKEGVGKIANNAFNIYIQAHMATNYSKIGKGTEAIVLLESCIRDEKKQHVSGTSEILAWLHTKMGRVHYRMKDFTKAVESFDTAIEYFGESIVHINDYLINLWYKAAALIALEQFEKGAACLKEGLPLAEPGTLFHTLFHALKFSLQLDTPTSLEYMEKTAIPHLVEHGQHLTAIDFCEKLSLHFEKTRKHARALRYTRMAFDIYKRLAEGVEIREGVPTVLAKGQRGEWDVRLA